MIRILLVDDHAIVREGLARIIEAQRDMSVVGAVADIGETMAFLDKEAVDVVLLDICLPGQDGIEALRQIKMRDPPLHVLILSMYDDAPMVLRAMRNGAAGYLSKESGSSQLLSAIRQVAVGARVIGPALVEKLILDKGSEPPLHEALSAREYSVLCMIGAGKPVSQIACDLMLSVKTVSTYRNRILRKLNMKNTAELTRYAIRHCLSA